MLVAGGSTNVTTYFAMRLAADGTAATGLTITTMDLQYVRSGAAPSAKVDATALGATNSAHADNQAIEIDATDQPGLYRVDWPDAAFAAAVREVILTVKCATCFTEHLRVTIDGEVNVVEWGGTDVVAGAIPAAVAGATGGVLIAGVNAPVTITSSTGTALTIQSTGSNGNGLFVQGNGTGDGLYAKGGSTGHGIYGEGGSTSGNAMHLVGGPVSSAFLAQGTHSGSGIEVTGGSTGHGIAANGGTNGDGIVATLGGTGVDIRGDITGDLTGTVATLTTYTGNTLQTGDVATLITTVGTAGDGLTAINLPNQTMDIVGDITGNLSGSVGSLTGHTNQTGDNFAIVNGSAGLVAIDTVVDAIKVVTDAIGATGTGLSAIPWNASWDAEVESEVNDALDTAIAELGVAAPTATPTLRTGMMLMYMALRNKLVVQTSGTDAIEIYNDAGTKIAAKTITDDGSDYTEDEMA